MSEFNRPWVTERLKQSLQLLACSPETREVSPFVHAPDEMALDFDNFRSAFVGNLRPELTSEQLHYLDLIDKTFNQVRKDLFQSRRCHGLW